MTKPIWGFLACALAGSCGSTTSEVTGDSHTSKIAMVSIAFDDGYESTFVNGVPVLNQFGYKATFYIIINRVGTSYMGTKNILALQTAGHEIGGHSLNHFPLDTASDSNTLREVKNGRDSLLSWGVKSVTTFAYPYGTYNARTPGIVQQAGFTSARTVSDGENFTSTNPYLLLSYSINDATQLSRVTSLIDRAVSDSAWLILTFHRVDEDGNSISIRHEYLQSIFGYLRDKHVPVLTVGEAFKRLHQ